MERIWRAAAAALFLMVTACSSAPSPQEQTENTERAAMTPLKTKYPEVVMGFDFHGPVADVSVDSNAELDMDDSVEDAMRNQAFTMWRAAWQKTHPGEHATLTVRILDFRGLVTWKKSGKV